MSQQLIVEGHYMYKHKTYSHAQTMAENSQVNQVEFLGLLPECGKDQ